MSPFPSSSLAVAVLRFLRMRSHSQNAAHQFLVVPLHLRASVHRPFLCMIQYLRYAYLASSFVSVMCCGGVCPPAANCVQTCSFRLLESNVQTTPPEMRQAVGCWLLALGLRPMRLYECLCLGSDAVR